MFKRFNKKGHQGIGDPTLIESTIYEDEYSNYRSKNSSAGQQEEKAWGQPPPRPSRDQVTGLPSLPFEPIQNQSAPRNSYNRPASSIYSQASPNMPDGSFPRHSVAASSVYDDEDVEISPPSSPEIGNPGKKPRRPIHEPVSPIISSVEEVPGMSRLQLSQPAQEARNRPGGSNIPILRREKRRNQVAAAAANLLSKKESNYDDGVKNKKAEETLYDPLTGEFTTSDRGRRQQVKPGEFTPPKAIVGTKSTSTTAVPAGQASFGDRVRKLKDTNMMAGARPEWKGSSGRSQPVPPVADQPDIPPLRIPPKSSLRSNSPRISDSGTITPVSAAFKSGKSETPVVSPTTSGYTGPMIRKVVPSGTGRNYDSSQPYASSPTSYLPPSTEPPISSKRHEKALPPPRDESNESTSTTERNFREALKEVNLPGASSYEQPSSRFSVTTYATTNASSTPRVSEDSIPPMPTPPNQNASIVNRKRPKIGNSLDSTNQIARKAVGEPVFISMSSASIASRRNSKMLPKSPPETESTDLITSLEAQLENLKQRRINLQRSIHQMTELMPTDPLARGMEARRQAEEKKKVEILREDLADVQREEHDLGLRLHRAWKRRDQNAIYEPTGLWVRRVTG